MAPAPTNTSSSNATNPQQYQQHATGYPAPMQQQVAYPEGYSYSQAPVPQPQQPYYYPQTAGYAQMPVSGNLGTNFKLGDRPNKKEEKRSLKSKMRRNTNYLLQNIRFLFSCKTTIQ